MSYTRKHLNSKLMNDRKFTGLIDDMMLLDLGSSLVVYFNDEKELRRIRYRLYSFLNAMGRKADFMLIKKKGEHAIEIRTTEPSAEGQFTVVDGGETL